MVLDNLGPVVRVGPNTVSSSLLIRMLIPPCLTLAAIRSSTSHIVKPTMTYTPMVPHWSKNPNSMPVLLLIVPKPLSASVTHKRQGAEETYCYHYSRAEQ